MRLRPYQQEAVDAVMRHVRSSVEPCLISASTGAGKSLIISEIARLIHGASGKRILCLAPSAELVVQNYGKMRAIGEPASIYSASAGSKSLRHPVVFASPLTVKNRIGAFTRSGRDGYAMVVIDECHMTTPTIRSIIDAMREANPNLRVVGLTATPYRLGTGYTFREWPCGKVNGEHSCRDPYYAKCVYEIGAHALIKQGYLTPPLIGQINAGGYDTSALRPNRMGNFDKAEVDKAYHGHGRKTAAIVADIVAQSRDRHGVLIFAATVQHAEEVMASLPPSLSSIVTGKTPKSERERMLKSFLDGRLKYMVNVAVLTTGFDAPHVDVVAILRKTESAALLQQIIGRGLRLHPGKESALILDYTTNMEDHFPDGDPFDPKIKAGPEPGDLPPVDAKCPECGTVNEFGRNKDYAEFDVDENGYIIDAMGGRVETEDGPIPAHHGRRCFGHVPLRSGECGRCEYRWSFKECPNCHAENDIAARYCVSCKGEIIDPNEKLQGDFRAMKRDPTNVQTDEVLSMTCKPSVSQRGNKTIRIEWVTPWRQFATWVMPDAKHRRAQQDYDSFSAATEGGETTPKTITYRKEADSGFYRVLAYNRPADEAPEGLTVKQVVKEAMAAE